MGTRIHLAQIERLFEKSPVVDFKSIARIIRSGKGKSRSNYAKLMVSNLLKKDKIHKVGKGYYSQHNESSLAVFGFQPAYLGLQSALSYYGLWEQETIPIILTTKKVRRGLRQVLGTNILVRNISRKYFFGFELAREESFYLPYSDLEKTLIDFVVFNEKIDDSVLKALAKRVDRDKLKKYLWRYPKKLRGRVEGVL
ncbi:hypothetical protein HZC30_01090 [Candidatus Woesearchaeota archaeon]|nr:hypothetical protein [Candidatus Woesearchaeota archaeon]